MMNEQGMGSAGVSPAVSGVPPNTSAPVCSVKLDQGECNGLMRPRPVQLNRTASQSVAAMLGKAKGCPSSAVAATEGGKAKC
jgi:hypothetical protein